MSTSFRWPTQLEQIGTDNSSINEIQQRYVLVRKKTDSKSGKQKTSSSSDGLIDIAAAVKLGLEPNAGLPSILLNKKHQKVLRLLQHNTVALVTPKHATIAGNHATKAISKMAEDALSAVLGPAYWQANKHLGTGAVLDTEKAIIWIKANLENSSSKLCNGLRKTPYEDLIGINRSQRWWLDRLRIRKSAE